MAAIVYSNKSLEQIESGYIHHGIKSVKWGYTKTFFKENNSIKSDLEKLTLRYKQELAKTLKISNSSGEELKIFDMDDDTVQAMFEEAANQLNQSIENNLINSFENAEIMARNSQDVFANSANFDKEKFNQMMNSIKDALRLVNSFDENVWNEFLKQYAELMAGRQNAGSQQLNASIRNLNGIIKTTNKPVMESVLKVLSNIPKKMLQGDLNYSAQQMVGTLNSIFDTYIGEQLAAIFVDMALEADKEIVEDWKKGGRNFSVAKTTGRDTVQSLIDSNRQVSGKVDVSKNGVLDITLKGNKAGNKDYTIGGQFNSSVKWYSPKSAVPSHISIQSINSYVALAKQIFNDDYSIYNTLAFYNANNPTKDSNFRIMRSSVIARYLDKFIAGTGQSGNPSGTIDTAQFLVVNGKFYPIFSVLTAYLQDIKDKELEYGSGRAGDLVYINMTDPDNEWIGDKNVKDITLAAKRSKKSKQAIDKFRINVSLNFKSLLPYIGKTQSLT